MTKQQTIQQLIEEIEDNFIHKDLTQYRHEISKKFWTKLKKKYYLLEATKRIPKS
mgnify:CR=1 FL=1